MKLAAVLAPCTTVPLHIASNIMNREDTTPPRTGGVLRR